MKQKLNFVILSAMLLLPLLVSAQSRASVSNGETALVVEGRSLEKQLSVLQDRKSILEKRLLTLSPDSPERALTLDWIRELTELSEDLQRGRSNSAGETPRAETLRAKVNLITASNPEALSSPSRVSTPLVPQVFNEPVFKLSRPIAGATNEITEVTLAWTEDHPCPTVNCPPVTKTYTITKFIVEIATNKMRFPNNRLAKPVFTQEVPANGSRAEGIKVPKETLKSGQKYFWQVLAEFVPAGGAAPLQKLAENVQQEPESFKTEAQTFDAFERRHLTLQRAVSGDDSTEGAQFGFLKTFNQQTVYSADFALIYNRQFEPTQRSSTAFQASVQGNLTSAESESEDALQFRAGAIIDRNLKRNTINHLYVSLAAKYEADQRFKVGKLISENMVTPTIPILGIGIPFGRSSDPIQFRWRPYFYFDVGHSFKNGDSSETQETVLRLTPRVRTTLTLNFLRRALNLNDTYVFADNFFYYLPLEKTKTQHNMFTSGFVLQVTRDFGFGVTYKSGEAAPKFKPVHTFGGVLTIRFGQDE